MFDIKASFQKLAIQTERYTRTLDENIKVQVRQAAREWLRAVIVKVPVWTGTSKASLQPLGAYLKVVVPVTPLVNRVGYGISEGRANQEFHFNREGNIWSFEFTEEVAHYLVNEYFDVSHYIALRTPGPYNSFKAGADAFQAYITEYLSKRVPNLGDFILTTEEKIS